MFDKASGPENSSTSHIFRSCYAVAVKNNVATLLCLWPIFISTGVNLLTCILYTSDLIHSITYFAHGQYDMEPDADLGGISPSAGERKCVTFMRYGKRMFMINLSRTRESKGKSHVGKSRKASTIVADST